MITALVAEFVEKISSGSAKAAGVKKAGLFGVAARWFVWIVGITTALSQLQVADVLVALFQSVLTGSAGTSRIITKLTPNGFSWEDDSPGGGATGQSGVFLYNFPANSYIKTN
jgi:hypothetical protein